MIKTRFISEFLFDDYSPDEALFPRWTHHREFATEDRELYLNGKDNPPTIVPVIKFSRLVSKDLGQDSEPTAIIGYFNSVAGLVSNTIRIGAYYETSIERPEGDYEKVFEDWGSVFSFDAGNTGARQVLQSKDGIDNLQASGISLLQAHVDQSPAHNVKNLELIFYYGANIASATVEPNGMSGGGVVLLLEQVG